MSKQIWTRAARDLLFETLVKKFGPYSTWKKSVATDEMQSSRSFAANSQTLLAQTPGRRYARGR